MTQGGYDLVTASGDASLRLIRGGTRAADRHSAASRATPTSTTATAGGGVALRRRQALRHALPVGPERADVQHQGLHDARRHPGRWCSRNRSCRDGKSNKGRVQAYDGPIYIADAALYLMAKKPELGIKDPYELNEAQYAAVLELLRAAAAAGAPLLARRQRRRCRTSPTKAWSRRARGRSRSTRWSRTSSRSPARYPRKAPPAGPTRRCCTTSAKHPNCAYKWMEWSLNAEGAGRRRGVVRLGAGGAGRLQGQCTARRRRAARPTASTTSTRSTSGARRRPPAACGTCVPYSRWATDYVAVMGGR